MAGIHWLDDQAEPSAALLGGKGANLFRLQKAAFRVPPGFVVDTDATAALDDPETVSAIVSAWSALNPSGAVAVAVRSSATDEDGSERSFAGQHETVLNIRDRGALLGAIADCVASLHSESAAAYRKEAGVAGAQMAVVVQRMVEAAFAGVAFSVDPVDGQERVVIEAVPGTGERLMAGTARGERVLVDRSSLAVTGREPAEGGLVTEEAAREIAEAALRAEALFGAPQDIEFAHDGEELWLLQSRPITAARARAGEVSEFDTPTDDDTFWTSANVQEVLPGLLTPLTISLSQNTSRVGYNLGFQQLGLLDRDEWRPFMGTFYNRAFLNLTVTRLIADRSPGGSADVVEQQYLAGDEGAETSDRERWLRRLRFKAKSALPLAKNLLTVQGTAERIDRQTRALEREIAALDTATLSGAALDDAFERVLTHTANIFGTHLQVSGIASTSFELVARLVRPVLREGTDARMPGLFSGMHGVESAQIGLDIWNLATVARNTGIEGTVLSGEFDPGDSSLPDGWRAAWRTFLARHGHRGLNEMEASARCWRREPKPVMTMVASYLSLPAGHSPPETLRRQETERLRLTKAIARRMNPVRRRVFRKALSDAQDWVSLRERTKSVIVRAARIPDYLMPAMQGRLVAKGVIDAPEDIYFLARDELREAMRAATPEGLQDRVVRRRKEYERSRHIILPDRFRGRPTPLEPAEMGEESATLRGTPVSPGIATGRARVILDPATDSPLEPGEILVAPVTDAGWTPWFALASGLVVDMGSALSHGSTVAREYGLPAVVNVHTATREIRSGDLVTVNGNAGTVTISRSGDEA